MIANDLASALPPPHALSQELGGETILLNMETECYYALNEVGTRFWQLLTELGEVSAAVARMETEYDIDKDTLHHDLTVLLGELQKAGLIVVK